MICLHDGLDGFCSYCSWVVTSAGTVVAAQGDTAAGRVEVETLEVGMALGTLVVGMALGTWEVGAQEVVGRAACTIAAAADRTSFWISENLKKCKGQNASVIVYKRITLADRASQNPSIISKDKLWSLTLSFRLCGCPFCSC